MRLFLTTIFLTAMIVVLSGVSGAMAGEPASSNDAINSGFGDLWAGQTTSKALGDTTTDDVTDDAAMAAAAGGVADIEPAAGAATDAEDIIPTDDAVLAAEKGTDPQDKEVDDDLVGP